jgi:hypothetical protein
MGTLAVINVLLLFYALPLILIMRSQRRLLGAVLVVLLSWAGFAIHRFAVVRASKRAEPNAA